MRYTLNAINMEIRITTRHILNILHVVSWIIFVGICIEAAAIIVNACATLFLNPAAAAKFWKLVDLSALYAFDPGYFLVISVLISIVMVMKAILFYLIIRILYRNKLDMSKPFSTDMVRFIFSVSYLALGIGFFSSWGRNYSEWLVKQGVKMPDLEYLHIGGASVWLFMGITLLVIAQIFRKGIELQSENDLTV